MNSYREEYQQLEIELAKWAGYEPEQVVACSSGTAALHLALEALQIPQGWDVVVPDFTMVACARAVTLAGLNPVFVDCDERLLIDQTLINNLETNLAAIMVVHVYGRKVPELPQLDWSQYHIIEDLAEAHGVRPNPFSSAACWSFYKNKIVAGEEGGAVAFRDPKHAELARQLRCLGFTPAHDFNHIPRGHNYRLANLLAQPIIFSLRAFAANTRARHTIESWYDHHCPPEWKMPNRDAVWVYDLRIPGLTASRQDKIVKALNAEGIPARHGFKPMSSLPEYAACRRVGGGRAGVAAQEVIYLPVTPGRTNAAGVAGAFDLLGRLIG